MKSRRHSHPHPHSTAPAGLSELAARLRGNSFKLTAPRQAILEVLRRESHPLSIRQIFELLPTRDCDLATVYRSMHVLENSGIVKRFDLHDGVARFELLREGDDGHHHHLVCTRCSEIVELEDCFTGKVEKRLASATGFKAITHKLEFFGLCPGCQQEHPSAT